MSEEPQVWHYGLMAERWAEFLTEAHEAPFYLQKIAQYGQPVLDVACGTGRVLLALLRAGVNVDGCDISGDMLHHCRSRAQREGFSPTLYAQPMHTFDLPHKYKTIYMCDSFGLAGGRENDLAALQRCYAHLEVGGALIVNIQAEYTSAEAWGLWLQAQRQALPEPWPENVPARVAADGSEHIGRFRTLHLDPLEQTYTRQVRLEKWRAGTLVAQEEYTLRGNMYFKHELLLMLKTVGFREIMVQGNYTDQPATAEHKELVFTAVR